MPASQQSSSSSSNQASGNSSKNTSSVQPKDRSDSSFHKEGGWGNMQNFAQSYGLKIHNDEDLEEAKAIRDAYREYDQRVWEEEQRNK